VFGAGAGEDRMDIDERDGEDAWTDAENDDETEDKSPERMAAEAAERRIATERGEVDERGEREASQPVIEDVD